MLFSRSIQLRANSDLKSHEYSVPVLGLIFLRYADHKFTTAQAKLTSKSGGRRTIGKADYQAQGVLYLPEQARFSTLLDLPEGVDIGKAINDAMRAIEADNEDLKGVLPKTYTKLDKTLLVSLLKNFAAVPMDIEGDAFGKIYEYFLGKFAMTEGQKGGEFFTPTSIVKLIVQSSNRTAAGFLIRRVDRVACSSSLPHSSKRTARRRTAFRSTGKRRPEKPFACAR